MRKNLKWFRLQRSLTQQQMADIIGCCRATYNKVEKGERDGKITEFWLRIEKHFNVQPDEMLSLMYNEVSE
jgi:DNA-binding XRE family transcriptional regulator